MGDVAIIVFATLAVAFLVGGVQVLRLRALRPLVPDATKERRQNLRKRRGGRLNVAAVFDTPPAPDLPPTDWLDYYKAKTRTVVSLAFILIAGAVGAIAFRQWRGKCHIMSVNCNDLNAQLDFKDTGEHTAKFCKEEVDVVSCGTSAAALYTFHPSTDTAPSENGELTPQNMAAAPTPIPLPLPTPQPLRDSGLYLDDAPADSSRPERSERLIDLEETTFRCDGQPMKVTSLAELIESHPSGDPLEVELESEGPRGPVVMCRRGSSECYVPAETMLRVIHGDGEWAHATLATIMVPLSGDVGAGTNLRFTWPQGEPLRHTPLGDIEVFEYIGGTRGRRLSCAAGLEELRTSLGWKVDSNPSDADRRRSESRAKTPVHHEDYPNCVRWDGEFCTKCSIAVHGSGGTDFLTHLTCEPMRPGAHAHVEVNVVALDGTRMGDTEADTTQSYVLHVGSAAAYYCNSANGHNTDGTSCVCPCSGRTGRRDVHLDGLGQVNKAGVFTADLLNTMCGVPGSNTCGIDGHASVVEAR